jgi:peptidoglycan/LPS O-acetylase OafA/YrhL
MREGAPAGALPKMPQLDALRAFAVFAVMYQHFGWKRWLDYFPTARLGVQLFFVLSGFLITAILLVARERIASGESRLFEVRQFYARRFLRIFPLYYAAVIGCAIIGIQGFREPLLWHLGYVTNIENAITDRFAGATAHLWSLSVEEQFYFFWPWVILFVPQRWLLCVLCAAAATGPLFRCVLFISGASNMALYMLTPSSFDAFGFGGLLALARQQRQIAGDNRLRRRLTRVGLIIGLPAVAITFWSLSWPAHYDWVFAIGANLASSLLFVWLIDRSVDGFRGPIRRVLTWPPILFAGKISYGLYVFHFIMAYAGLKLLLTCPIFQGLKHILSWRGATFSTLLAMTFAAASLSWFLYERPLLNLKRFFPYSRKRT